MCRFHFFADTDSCIPLHAYSYFYADAGYRLQLPSPYKLQNFIILKLFFIFFLSL